MHGYQLYKTWIYRNKIVFKQGKADAEENFTLT